jgi:hypothetical protein
MPGRMLRKWLKRRGEQRRAELEARAPWVREATVSAVHEVAAPLVARGLARVEWTEPGPEDDDGYIALVPANDAAAVVVVAPGPAFVTMLVGPDENSHELVVDDDGDWQRELRACLEAVIEGRYRETASPGWVSRRVVTMTFEIPDGNDVVVKHHDLTEGDHGEEEPPPERRFAGYVRG